jgi:tetratricopeptide (TPR) repeat protein
VLDSRQQQVQKALAEFEEARKQFEALGEHGAMAGLQYQLGAAYNRWGRLPEAEAADRTCMEQAGVVGDGYDLLRCRQQLATIALQRAHTDEDYAAVRGDLTGIIEDAGHQGFQILQARAWLSASQVDAMRNRFTDAERSLNEALARAEGEESARVKALINLARADLFLRTKRPEPAEKDAEAAAVFFREDGTLKELAQALLLKGRALQEQFRFEDALKEFQAEQAVAAKVSPGNEAQAIEASGTVYQYQENYPAAANRFRRALELGGSTAGAAYYRLELARALIELGRWEEAKAALAPLDGAKLLPGLRQRLSLERASMQLFSGGTRSIRNELKGTAPDDPEVLLLEGQADLLARSFRSAREKCGLALANESAAQERHFAAVSSICAAEAALGAGAAQESLDLLASHEAVWAAFPVQRLRGLVLRSEALKAIGRNEEWKAPLEGAVSVVSGLIALWGPGDFQSFQNRADVRGNPVLLNFIHGESK